MALLSEKLICHYIIKTSEQPFFKLLRLYSFIEFLDALLFPFREQTPVWFLYQI